MKKTEKNILGAFCLNLFFAIFEIIGGIYTGSIAIISDAFHDFLDSISIGISYGLEKISKRKANEKYTFGYLRYSTLGAFITTLILIVGSCMVIYHSLIRIMNPVPIHYEGMIFFAFIGVMVNLLAAYLTKDGESLNQKSVNLHMIEDVLNWIIVLIGAIVMKFTKFYILDSLMSIGVSLFLLVQAFKNLRKILALFLDKVPNQISVEEIKRNLLNFDGICDIHHIHIWSMDGIQHYATMHVVVCDCDMECIKEVIRDYLYGYGIKHVTLEIEQVGEHCDELECQVEIDSEMIHHHHH